MRVGVCVRKRRFNPHMCAHTAVACSHTCIYSGAALVWGLTATWRFSLGVGLGNNMAEQR
eukprot:355846-Chlamydomonas_euryale.AAC.3